MTAKQRLQEQVYAIVNASDWLRETDWSGLTNEQLGIHSEVASLMSKHAVSVVKCLNRLKLKTRKDAQS